MLYNIVCFRLVKYFIKCLQYIICYHILPKFFNQPLTVVYFLNSFCEKPSPKINDSSFGYLLYFSFLFTSHLVQRRPLMCKFLLLCQFFSHWFDTLPSSSGTNNVFFATLSIFQESSDVFLHHFYLKD